MRDIQMVLERWGAWVANNHEDVEWSSVAAGFKGLIPSKVKSRPQCSDDDGLIISSAMTVLKKKEPYQYELLEMYYVYGVTLRVLGVKLGISLNQVVIRLQKAEGFIDGCLAMLGASLEIDCYI
ncbi:antiterminator Q family protein [Escherichia coli]|uniref:antiterminator Q family protein n=1 Tax=Escherichia coli TaxID=562 RepID=UPI0004D73016|nr:antiterminator Q family protein [Escherichia coli]EEU9261811.1 antitermination protein [Escherichia coli]EFC9937807.1 antitermination protein [Escherichia coli]EFI9263991.1 antitermination protein [Escherichia coli]EGM7907855.1 antitermination protein [Escherichia coli]KDX17438.1 phage antitermination Q family protein [Escherichia coli 2-210-07_S3_C3]